jgi:hypothetical protein
MHCGAEVTESSTNKQHHQSTSLPAPATLATGVMSAKKVFPYLVIMTIQQNLKPPKMEGFTIQWQLCVISMLMIIRACVREQAKERFPAEHWRQTLFPITPQQDCEKAEKKK